MGSDDVVYALTRQWHRLRQRYAKRLIILSGLVVSVAVGIPIFNDIQNASNATDTDRVIEVLNSTITGYTHGKRNWTIAADYIYSDAYQTIYTGTGITNGTIVNDQNQVVIRDINAQAVRVNTSTKIVYAKGGVSAQFIQSQNRPSTLTKILSSNRLYAAQDAPQQDDPHNQDPDSFIQIKSDSLKYVSATHSTILSGHVELTHGDAKIYPKETVEIDTETNIAKITGGVQIVVDDFNISAEEMTIYIDDQRALLTGINAVRNATLTDTDDDSRETALKSQSTRIQCHSMSYEKNNGQIILHLSGQVQLLQSSKQLTSDTAIYNEATGDYTVAGNVKIHLNELRWILDSAKTDGFKNDHLRSTLTQSTTITCDQLTFSKLTHRLELNGNVTVIQPNQSINARKITLDDEQNILKCLAPLSIKRNGKESFTAQYLEVNLVTEDIIAKSKILSEFFIKK